MTKDEAMRLALEALESAAANESNFYDYNYAAEALRQALEQPEREPFEMKWPDYNESAMGCGIEDRNITDRYEAMQYGWDEAISRVSECLPDVLFTAPPSKQEPDYGIDRGAWSDVPDATKWVDELRGDEEPSNSTTDVVEPVAWWSTLFNVTYIPPENFNVWESNAYKAGQLQPLFTAPPKPAQDLIVGYADVHDLTRAGHDFWVSREPGKNTVPLYLYGHPPKIWQGLTNEEIVKASIGHVEGEHMLRHSFARAIEKLLREKNHG